MMNTKKLLCGLMAVSMLTAGLTACGPKKTASSTGENIVEQTTPEGHTVYDVKLDERDQETSHQYGEEDLGFVDTQTGKKVYLGMTAQEVEEVTGAAASSMVGGYQVYDGIVVQYSDENVAVSMIVAEGNMTDPGFTTRYATARGVKLGMVMEDFKKTYGDEVDIPEDQNAEGEEGIAKSSTATRYIVKNGKKLEYIGTNLTKENRPEETANLYLQDFLFNNESQSVTSMRISTYDAIYGA